MQRARARSHAARRTPWPVRLVGVSVAAAGTDDQATRLRGIPRPRGGLFLRLDRFCLESWVGPGGEGSIPVPLAPPAPFIPRSLWRRIDWKSPSKGELFENLAVLEIS